MRETLFVRHGRLHFFVREVLKRLRVPGPHASRVAEALVAADLVGVEGEGVRRLPHFASRLSTGLINPNPGIQVVQQEQATATLDGDNGLGHIVASRAMELALSLAKKHGVAAVAARRSNDLGLAGFYARMALDEQMIGIVSSNAPPVMVPPYGTLPALGANPLAIAIPGAEDAPPFVLDMATTATSRPQLEDAARRRENIPRGLALDGNGKPTEDPKAALEARRFLPLGSSPETGSHKGFGLALAIDVLAGVLAGAGFGSKLAGAEAARPEVAGIGHFVLAVRVRAFGPWVRFRNQMKEMMQELVKNPAAGAPRVYYPGEAEAEIEEDRRKNGIPIDPEAAEELEGLAKHLDIRDAWEHLVEGRK